MELAKQQQSQQNKLTQQLVTKLKYVVYRDLPFFGPIDRTLLFEYQQDMPSKAGTDGSIIYVNDEFLLLNSKEQNFIHLHELLHVLYKHPLRFSMLVDHQHHVLYNIITDVKINEQLKELRNNHFSMFVVPDQALTLTNVMGFFDKCLIFFSDKDKVFATLKNDKLSAEEQYDIIKQLIIHFGSQTQQTQQTQQNSETTDETNIYMDLRKVNLQQAQEIERKINEAIAQGLVEQKLRDKRPLKIVEEFENILLRKEVDWRKVVKNYIRTMLRGNRTYNKLHKKTFSNSIIIPGYKKKEKLEVTIGVDVSGSISDDEFKKFMGECLNLVTNYDAKMTVVQFDTNIVQEDVIKKKKDIWALKKRHACGGTSYKEFLDKYKSAKVKVIFTDGFGDQNKVQQQKNVVWLTTKNTKFPWGKVIKIHNK